MSITVNQIVLHQLVKNVDGDSIKMESVLRDELLSITPEVEKHKAPVDLSLIALGNMASNLLTTSVPQTQREALAQAFSNSLINAVKTR